MLLLKGVRSMYKIAQENLPKLYAALAEAGTLFLPCKKNATVNFAPYSAQADVAIRSWHWNKIFRQLVQPL